MSKTEKSFYTKAAIAKLRESEFNRRGWLFVDDEAAAEFGGTKTVFAVEDSGNLARTARAVEQLAQAAAPTFWAMREADAMIAWDAMKKNAVREAKQFTRKYIERVAGMLVPQKAWKALCDILHVDLEADASLAMSIKRIKENRHHSPRYLFSLILKRLHAGEDKLWFECKLYELPKLWREGSATRKAWDDYFAAAVAAAEK